MLPTLSALNTFLCTVCTCCEVTGWWVCFTYLIPPVFTFPPCILHYLSTYHVYPSLYLIYPQIRTRNWSIPQCVLKVVDGTELWWDWTYFYAVYNLEFCFGFIRGKEVWEGWDRQLVLRWYFLKFPLMEAENKEGLGGRLHGSKCVRIW